MDYREHLIAKYVGKPGFEKKYDELNKIINTYLIESSKSKRYEDFIKTLKIFSKTEPDYIFEEYILSMHIFAYDGEILQLKEYRNINKEDF